MRTIIGIASIVVLLAFTVLLPPAAFFDPQVTPDEVQLPDERPCEDHNCKDTTLYLQGQSEVKELLPSSQEQTHSWPHRPLLRSQFDPKNHLKPPSHSA